MSLFVKVATGFYGHRKTAILKSKIGEAAWWLPPRLWAYAASQQPDGDFSRYSATDLAAVLGYAGDAESMLQALLQAGFMDEGPRIHDWQEHNGYHQTYSERARKAAIARWKPAQDELSPNNPSSSEKEIEKERETSIASSMPQACFKHPKGKKGAKASPPPPDLDSMLNDLQSEPAYDGLDVRKVHAKMTVWCKANGKQPTYKRLVNWLNSEKPLPAPSKAITPGKPF